MKVLEVTTSTCSVCKMLAPMVKMACNSENVELDVQIADGDNVSEECKNILKEYQINSVPVFFFIKDGKVLDKHFGAITLSDFKNKIKENNEK